MGASSRVAPHAQSKEGNPTICSLKGYWPLLHKRDHAIRKGLVPKINRDFPVGVPATGDVRSDPPRFPIT